MTAPFALLGSHLLIFIALSLVLECKWRSRADKCSTGRLVEQLLFEFTHSEFVVVVAAVVVVVVVVVV